MQIWKKNLAGARMLGLISCTVSLLFVSNKLFISIAHAQDQCANALAEAEKLYETGRYAQVIALLNRCLPDSIRDKMRAYRFLALAYLAEDFPDKAEESIKNLLKQDRNYLPAPGVDPQQFIELVAKVKKRLGEPIIRLVKLNLGYPFWFPNDNIIDLYKGGFVAGFEILLGKKFLGGFSYDYINFTSGTGFVTGEVSPIPIGLFESKATGQFYSVAFMYKPYHSSQSRKIAPYGLLKVGIMKRKFDFGIEEFRNLKDNDKMAYSIAAGIDIPFKTFFHSFIGFDYTFTKKSGGLAEFEAVFNYARTYLTGKIGTVVYF